MMNHSVNKFSKYLMNKGFTLIELLIVVAIIGILATIGVASFNGITTNAKITATKANHQTVTKFVNTKLMLSMSNGGYLNNMLSIQNGCSSQKNYKISGKSNSEVGYIIQFHLMCVIKKHPWNDPIYPAVGRGSHLPQLGMVEFRHSCVKNVNSIYEPFIYIDTIYNQKGEKLTYYFKVSQFNVTC